MATISSIGISGSGIDETVISKLLAVEQQPIAQVNKRTDTLKTQLSTYGQIQSSLSALRDAAAKLTNPDTWAGAKTTSSDPTAISVAASTGAAIGNVSVEVTKLAQSQALASSTFASPTASIGKGSITIELGSWATADNTSTFTSKSGTTPVTINIGDGQDQLTQVRDQINSANAGVVASIVTDATGSRLTLTSRATGETNGFKVTVNDSDGDSGDAAGLSQLAYDPSNGVSQMSLTLPAQNARAILNGLPISSETNSLSSAIDGINIMLLKITPPVSISVTQDADAIKKAVSDFTTAYNAVNQLLRAQTKYDSASKTAAPLQGDSAAIGLNNRLRGIASGTTSLSSGLHRLSDVGLAPGTDGNLPTAGAKLDKALTNLDDLKKFFMGVDSADDSNSGFAVRMRAMVDQALSVDGSVSSRQKGLQTAIDNNNKRVDQLTERSESFEKRLRAQYSALDTKMSSLSSLANYVTQQINQFNKG